MEYIITIIGFGNIGRFITALLLSYEGYRFKINIIDPDEAIIGAYMDIDQGMAFFPNHQLVLNDQAALRQSDFIFHCAGASVPKGASRLATSRESIEITKAIFKDFKTEKEPFIIVVANPVEVITTVTQRLTGLAPERVIGTGTALDSIRMNRFAQQQFDWPAIDMVLLGEHGSSVFFSRQLSTVNGESVDMVWTDVEIQALMDQVRGAANEIKATQSATIYGVSYCAIKIFDALMTGHEIRLPVSTLPTGPLEALLDEYPVAISLYATIGKQGASVDLSYMPNAVELSGLRTSAALIQACVDQT